MKVDRIHQVAVAAIDLDEAIAFYRDVLGARFLAKFDPPGLAFFDFSGTRLLLEGNAPKATVYFRVDDIDAACDKLRERGVELTHEPHRIFHDEDGTFGDPGDEEWMAFFEDPSGNVLALATQRPAER